MSNPKKLYKCPLCGCGMRVVKSWLSTNGVRKQRVECSNLHRLTLDVMIVPNTIALNRLMRRHRCVVLNNDSRGT